MHKIKPWCNRKETWDDLTIHANHPDGNFQHKYQMI